MTTYSYPSTSSVELSFNRSSKYVGDSLSTRGAYPVGRSMSRVTPGYRKFVKRAPIKGNDPYKKSCSNKELKPASFSSTHSGGTINWVTDLMVETPSVTSWGFHTLRHRQWESLENAVLSGLNNRVVDVRAGTIETFAEANQTFKMVLKMVQRIIRCLYYIKRGKFSMAWKGLYASGDMPPVSKSMSVAEIWLEFRYGWLPLTYSITDTLIALWKECKTGQIKTCSYRAQSRQTGSKVMQLTELTNVSGVFNCPGYSMSIAYQKSFEEEISVNGGYLYEITHPNIVLFEELGLVNLASVAWELTPASFIVDWVLNVGTILEQLTTFSGKRLISGYLSYKRVYTEDCSARAFYPNNFGIKLSGDVVARCMNYQMDFERVPFKTQPLIKPMFSNGLNPKRIFDAASIIRTLLK